MIYHSKYMKIYNNEPNKAKIQETLMRQQVNSSKITHVLKYMTIIESELWQ